MNGRLPEQDWQLVHHDGDVFFLYNRSESEVSLIEIAAVDAQLDAGGKDYVRREKSVDPGGYIELWLRPVWRGPNQPHLMVTWTSGDVRREKTIMLEGF